MYATATKELKRCANVFSMVLEMMNNSNKP